LTAQVTGARTWVGTWRIAIPNYPCVDMGINLISRQDLALLVGRDTGKHMCRELLQKANFIFDLTSYKFTISLYALPLSCSLTT
jgi:hypothetical protein